MAGKMDSSPSQVLGHHQHLSCHYSATPHLPPKKDPKKQNKKTPPQSKQITTTKIPTTKKPHKPDQESPTCSQNSPNSKQLHWNARVIGHFPLCSYHWLFTQKGCCLTSSISLTTIGRNSLRNLTHKSSYLLLQHVEVLCGQEKGSLKIP